MVVMVVMVIMLVLVMVMGMSKFIVMAMGGLSKHFTVATYPMDYSANHVLKYMFEKERLDFEGNKLECLLVYDWIAPKHVHPCWFKTL